MAIFICSRPRTRWRTTSDEQVTVSVSLREVKRLQFYWGSSIRGSPEAVLKLTKDNNFSAWDVARYNYFMGYDELFSHRLGFWPNGGISVHANRSPLLIIIGQAVVQISTGGDTSSDSKLYNEADAAVSFRELCSAIFVVSNPRASPDQWDYAHLVVPKSSQGDIRW